MAVRMVVTKNKYSDFWKDFPKAKALLEMPESVISKIDELMDGESFDFGAYDPDDFAERRMVIMRPSEVIKIVKKYYPSITSDQDVELAMWDGKLEEVFSEHCCRHYCGYISGYFYGFD